MSAYTVEQYQQAAKRAYDAGNTKVAKSLAQKGLALRKQQNQQFQQDNMLPSADVDTSVRPKPPERFGDTVKEFAGPALNAAGQAIQRSFQPDRTFFERVKDYGEAGLMGLGGLYAGGAATIGEILGGDRTQERKAARDMMMLGEVAVPELAGVPSAVSRIARAGTALPDNVKRAQAAQDLNIVPNLGTQGKVGAMIDAGLETNLLTASRGAQAADRTVSGMEDVLSNNAAKLGKATSEEAAGEALKKGGDAFISGFKAKSATLYNDVDKFIDPQSNVSAPNAVASLIEMTRNSSEFPSITALTDGPVFGKILGDLTEDLGGPMMLREMPYSTLKALRTEINDAISLDPLGGAKNGKLKKLAASLKTDMELAAKNAGPQAEAALKRANDYYAENAKIVKKAMSKIAGENVTPEQAYRNLVAMTQGKGKGDIKKLAQLKASLPKDSWATASATIVRKMGETIPSQRTSTGMEAIAEFSPNTFLTNWHNTSNSAKTILTSGNMDRSTLKELNKLATVVNGFKQGQRERNFSKTGQALTTGAGVGAAFAEPVTAAIVAGNLILSSRALTNKTFLKALNSARAGQTFQLKKIVQDGTALSSEASSVLRLMAADQMREEDNPNAQE